MIKGKLSHSLRFILMMIGVMLLFHCSTNEDIMESRNNPPTCFFEHPTHGETLGTADEIPISIHASDDDGRIVSVKFYVDDEFIASDMDSPFVFIWTPPIRGYGRHTLRADARDDQNGMGHETIFIHLTYEYRKPVAMEDGWETDSLQNVGMDLEPLKELMCTLHDGEDHRIHSFLILKDNKEF